MPLIIFDLATFLLILSMSRYVGELKNLTQTIAMLVAIGGGSTIDVAKCIKLFCKMDSNENYLK